MIARTSFLPHLLVTFGLAGTASVLTACNGRIVSLGDTGDSSDKLTSVDPTTSVPTGTSTAISACPAGFAHPNICCDAAPGQEATCGEWTLDPFRACTAQGPAWTTYPNAFECCDLTNPTACMETPVDAGANVPPPPSPIGCGFVCPPGWWSSTNGDIPVASSSSSSSGGAVSGGTSTNSGGTATSGSSSGPITGSGSSGSSGYSDTSCCTILADGTTECDGLGYAEPVTTACAGSGGSSSGSVIAPTPQPGPIILADGGVVTEDAGVYGDDGGFYSDDGGTGYDDDGGFYCEDAGSYYPPGYDGGTTSLCGECPVGWLPDSLDPLLCCQTTADQTAECFSQATGSASGIGSVSGSSSSGSSSAGSGSSSSGGGVTTPIAYPTDAGVTSNGGN